jgi:hypothetical protein
VLGLCGEHIHTGVIHCLFDKIPNLQIALPPQTKPRRGGGLKHLPLLVNF